jgi:hypothetical protein
MRLDEANAAIFALVLRFHAWSARFVPHRAVARISRLENFDATSPPPDRILQWLVQSSLIDSRAMAAMGPPPGGP